MASLSHMSILRTTDVRMPHIISRPSRTTWYGEDKLLKESGGALD